MVNTFFHSDEHYMPAPSHNPSTHSA